MYSIILRRYSWLKDSLRHRLLEAGAALSGNLTACLRVFEALRRVHCWLLLWSVRCFSQTTLEKFLEDF